MRRHGTGGQEMRQGLEEWEGGRTGGITDGRKAASWRKMVA